MKTKSSSSLDPSVAFYKELKWGSKAPPLDGSGDNHHHHDETASASSEPSLSESSDTNFLPLQAEKTALLVVDVQPEYWSQCPAVRKDFPHFPERLRATVECCRERKVAKIIWVRADYRYSHSPWLKQFARIHGLPAAATTNNNNREEEPSPRSVQVNNNGNTKLRYMRAEVPCDPSSKEFQWEEFATPQGGEVILPKTSWSSTSNTGLMDVLRAANVDTVLVCGLITSVCVQHSAFGVFEAGYRTILITDACGDRGKARHEAALALYGDYMYELLSSEDLRNEASPRGLKSARPVWILSTHPTTTTALCSSNSLSTSTSMSSLVSSPAVWSSHADQALTSTMSELVL